MRPPHLRPTVTSAANTRARSLANPRQRGRGEDSAESSGFSFAASESREIRRRLAHQVPPVVVSAYKLGQAVPAAMDASWHGPRS